MGSTRLDIINGHLWSETSAVLHRADYQHQFLYSLNSGGGILSNEDRTFYEKNGFLVIPDLVPHHVIDQCQQRFGDLCEGRVPRGNITLMRDVSVAKSSPSRTGEALIYKAQDILFDEVFQQYFLNEKMLDVVECITGGNIMAMHSMLINKPPDTGSLSSRHPLHQDLYYFPFRPADRIVAAWTAMETVNEDNGCLFVLPGSHKGILLQHEYPDWEGGVNKAFHGIPYHDDHPKAYLPMTKGETVFFHPLLIHGSGYNKTNGFRKAISCHYASSECYYIDVEGTVQEPIAKEIEQMAVKKGVMNLKIQDIWRYRSRLVRGVEVNL